MNGGKTYRKQHNKNTAIRACTNVIKTCHGHVLNVCFSATLWTFHFETATKRAARYVLIRSYDILICGSCPCFINLFPSTGVPKLFHSTTHLDKYNLFQDPPKYLR